MLSRELCLCGIRYRSCKLLFLLQYTVPCTTLVYVTLFDKQGFCIDAEDLVSTLLRLSGGCKPRGGGAQGLSFVSCYRGCATSLYILHCNATHAMHAVYAYMPFKNSALHCTTASNHEFLFFYFMHFMHFLLLFLRYPGQRGETRFL